MDFSDLFISGFLLHQIGDWFIQNEWMATKKHDPKHYAGWLHGLLQGLIQLFVFPVWAAVVIGVSHWAIDLRTGLVWWRKTFGQTTSGDFTLHVAVWQDQVAHWLVLALMAKIVAG